MNRLLGSLLVLGLGIQGAYAHHPVEGLPWADALEHLLEWDHLAMVMVASLAGWLIIRKVKSLRRARSQVEQES